ncbi:hypothetical protein LMG28138_02450 [Pararobbsia alpina]|uniref:Uncharacterized protein n=1 Tax=Pararobbsia alpina TaxID=621374 RepID=A0A6S7B4K8_9BURK|nr:hypothetical protein LMG28138_02450 [Pararobbsia alpina]
MTKYPASATRFAVADRQVRAPRLSKLAQRAHQCPKGQGCASPGTFESCERNFHPK